VPPVADAVNVTGVPTVPVDGPVIAAVRARGETVIVAEPMEVCELASVIITLTVYVPFTSYVVVNVPVEPLDGVPPVAVQANV